MDHDDESADLADRLQGANDLEFEIGWGRSPTRSGTRSWRS
jgi:hypothetical protein